MHQVRPVSLPTFSDLHGTVALVTGGASGIGAATATLLAHEGATVVVADVQDDLGAAVADAIGGRFVHLDVTDSAAWGATVAEVIAIEGRLDIAHLNAGVMTGEGDLRALTDAQLDRVLGVNVRGVVHGARAVTTAMTGGGGIVATASVAGLIGWSADPIYTLSKHAVVGLVRALDPQLAALGISINAVCPGIVDTAMLGEEMKAVLEGVGVPIIPPTQIADGVLHALRSGQTGTCFQCLPGRPAEPFAFGELAVPLMPTG
jgi:NAD(P)-dependent dehydrogenase (short-subunit alcohol dehydrogenase family)